VLSAHRTPHDVIEFIKLSESNGCKVFIAAAGMAAHLAGALAAHTTKPVIGIPIESGGMGGIDSLLSTVMMPPGVPVALKPLVGVIELVSVLLVRPFSLAVRLFANLVAGHVMLSLLLASAYFFIVQQGGADYILSKAPVGLAWFTLGLGIYGFELIVSILQAYIFTLLSAVYIQTSLHPEH
jgi:F0F1-type ATP synthase membrane subunit a